MTSLPDALKDNPLLQDWSRTGDLPDFAAIRPEHFEPAMRFAMQVERDEIKAITSQRRKPTFENTIVALERTGDLLDQVEKVFNTLAGVKSDKAMQALNSKLSPLLSKHASWMFQNRALFRRVKAVHEKRDELEPVQRRLTEEIYKNFIDSGADLPPEGRRRLARIDAEEARLGARFSNNLTNQVAKPALLLSKEDDLAGLPQFVRDAAAEKARELGKPGKFAFVPTEPVVDNFLTYSTRRDLREKIFTAYKSRNDCDDRYDNKALASKLLGLAAEKAALLGYNNPAEMELRDNMVKTPANAEALLRESWNTTLRAFARDRAVFQEVAQGDGLNEPLQPWDWHFYARRVREDRFKLNDDEVKSYLSLDNLREAAFAAAGLLWGVKFKEVTDAKLYHPDARMWEVTEADGTSIGRFIGDYFSRETKEQGAWMNELRTQHGLDGGQRPIVFNVCNTSRAPAGQPSLLSLDEAKTLFHEFGHGLHGLLSKVEYPTLAGCNGPMDYVELPSQFFEKLLFTPAIMRHLKHCTTGEAMPQALADRIHATENVKKSHEMVEFLASAIVDLELHKLKDARNVDLRAFEQDTLKKWGMPEGMAMRHRLPHFSHIFGGGYTAAYNSYEHAAVLDCDAFAAFTEAGDPFHQPTAARLRKEIYASGASRDSMESFVAFRGRKPKMDAMFQYRGFTPA